MQRIALLALIAVVLLVGSRSESYAEKRVALIIGNSAYKYTQALPNPKNDANAIATAFKAIGFQSVVVKTDLGIDEMLQAFRAFGDQADDADTAVVFFAGHGMELGGDNYLIPTDARLRKDRHLQYEAIKLSSVLQSVEGAQRLRLVMLDACRNNPFAASMRLSGSAKRSVARGFGRIEPDGDVLVAYASRHGTTADDGKGKHSPYTRALLDHIAEPGVDIRLLLGKVRDSVKVATGGEQVPHIYGTLGGRNVFLVPPEMGSDGAKVAGLEERLRELEAKLQEKNKTKLAVGIFPEASKPSAQRSYEPGDEFRDCKDCPKLVVVPAGSFMMNSLWRDYDPDKEFDIQAILDQLDLEDCGLEPPDETCLKSVKKEKADRERRLKLKRSPRKVTIRRPIAIGKFEVTRDEFHAFVRSASYKPTATCLSEQFSPKIEENKANQYLHVGFEQAGDHPVVCVTWQDAKAYTLWLNEKVKGAPYRLLSEAEWEYAWQAGGTLRKYAGTEDFHACEHGNILDLKLIESIEDESDLKSFLDGEEVVANCDDKMAYTGPVGHFFKNMFGIYDLVGNANEWVEDCKSDSFTHAPNDGSARTKRACELRITRGSSYITRGKRLSKSYRFQRCAMTDCAWNFVGFRVARELPE